MLNLIILIVLINIRECFLFDTERNWAPVHGTGPGFSHQHHPYNPHPNWHPMYRTFLIPHNTNKQTLEHVHHRGIYWTTTKKPGLQEFIETYDGRKVDSRKDSKPILLKAQNSFVPHISDFILNQKSATTADIINLIPSKGKF